MASIYERKTSPRYIIHFGNCHRNITEQELFKYFSNYAKILDCRLNVAPNNGKSTEMGYIIVKTQENFNKILEKDHFLSGRKLILIPLQKKETCLTGPGWKIVKVMYVTNLNPLNTINEVHKYFSESGKISELFMYSESGSNRNTGFCVIVYEEETSLERLSERQDKVLDSCALQFTRNEIPESQLETLR